MNTKQYRYVLELARVKNFSQAARNLGISQPSLSQYIKKLEDKINAQLFIRCGTELKLTDAGEQYIKTAGAVINLERELKSRLDDINKGNFGTIKIGASPYCSSYVLPKAIKKFHQEYPDISIIIEELTSQEMSQNVKNAECDLYIATYSPEISVSLNTAKIRNEELVLTVPNEFDINGHLANSAKKDNRQFPVISIQEVNNQYFAVMNEYTVMGTQFNKICETNKLNIKKRLDCTKFETIIKAVTNGIALALIPDTIAQQNLASDVKYYSLSEKTPLRSLFLFYRSDAYLSTIAQKFISYLT